MKEGFLVVNKKTKIKSVVIEYKNDVQSRNKLIDIIIDYLIGEKFNFGGEDGERKN